MADSTKHSGGLQSEQAKSFTGTWRSTPGHIRLRYHSYYSYGSAKLEEWFTLEQKRFTLFRHRIKWRTMGYPTEVGQIDYRGDLKWAQRLAKDLGVEIPEVTHRLSAWRPKTVKATTALSVSAKSAPLGSGGEETHD